MGFTIDDLTNPICKLRLLIPDNNPDDYEFEDEELQVYLDLASQNLTLARINIYYSLAAKYNRTSGDDVRIDEIEIKENKDKTKRFLELAKALEDAYASGSTLEYVPNILTTGVFVSDLELNRDYIDSDIIVDKMFDMNTFNNNEIIY